MFTKNNRYKIKSLQSYSCRNKNNINVIAVLDGQIKIIAFGCILICNYCYDRPKLVVQVAFNTNKQVLTFI